MINAYLLLAALFLHAASLGASAWASSPQDPCVDALTLQGARILSSPRGRPFFGEGQSKYSTAVIFGDFGISIAQLPRVFPGTQSSLAPGQLGFISYLELGVDFGVYIKSYRGLNHEIRAAVLPGTDTFFFQANPNVFDSSTVSPDTGEIFPVILFDAATGQSELISEQWHLAPDKYADFTHFEKETGTMVFAVKKHSHTSGKDLLTGQVIRHRLKTNIAKSPASPAQGAVRPGARMDLSGLSYAGSPTQFGRMVEIDPSGNYVSLEVFEPRPNSGQTPAVESQGSQIIRVFPALR